MAPQKKWQESSKEGKKDEPEEKRVDPEDGNAYTHAEIMKFYKGTYSKKDSQAYWENDCVLTKKHRKPEDKEEALVAKDKKDKKGEKDTKDKKDKKFVKTLQKMRKISDDSDTDSDSSDESDSEDDKKKHRSDKKQKKDNKGKKDKKGKKGKKDKNDKKDKKHKHSDSDSDSDSGSDSDSDDDKKHKKDKKDKKGTKDKKDKKGKKDKKSKKQESDSSSDSDSEDDKKKAKKSKKGKKDKKETKGKKGKKDKTGKKDKKDDRHKHDDSDSDTDSGSESDSDDDRTHKKHTDVRVPVRQPADVLKQVTACKVIPVVGIEDVSHTGPLCNALVAGGITIIEIVYRTDCALEAMKEAVTKCEGICVGAGTVLTVQQAADALDVGVDFIVSPGFDAAVAVLCRNRNALYLPGCVTPTEVMNASSSFNLKALKFFPAGNYGGVGTLKSFASVFSDIVFMPTGGVSEANIGEFTALPNVVACGGSWITKDMDKCAASGDWSSVSDVAKKARLAAGCSDSV